MVIRVKVIGVAINVLVFFCFLLPLRALDTLGINQSLLDGTTIVSSGGVFELGFFYPDNSLNRYLGIWFKKVTKVTVVWVANRDTPLNDKSGVLKITDEGVLTLVNSTNSIIWFSNFTGPVKNPVAQLLDSGNLVVRDANDDNPDNFMWQSFDHPSNVQLPGMKFGLNLVTGIDRKIQSWKSTNDPSRGDYVFRMDSNGLPQEFLVNDSVKIFRSGPWNGIRWSGSPGLKPNSLYTYGYVNTPQEIYYKFDLINTSIYSILTLNPNGVLQRLTWNYKTQDWTVLLNAPADNCDHYGLCYENGVCSLSNSPVCSCLDKFVPKSLDDWQAADWSSGCVRRVPLDCQKGDGFKKYSGIKLPDTRLSWYNQSVNLDNCKQMCLKNCSCTAYANTDVRDKGSGCVLWFDDLMDITQLSVNGQDIYIRLASSEVGSTTHRGKTVGISLGVIGGFSMLILFLILYIKQKRKEKRRSEHLVMEGNVENSSEHLHRNVNEPNDLNHSLFDLEAIVKATNNFSKDNKLGEGGYGPVYKGVLRDGQEIAVKRLSEYSVQGVDEFKNEVECIAKLQHRNLVKLLGCCIQSEEKMLIYEFMPNKSLDYFIFDKNRNTLLDWPMRYEIIMGIARGMLYLHQDSRLRIIHRDLKAANILLDGDMKPKISDFGMARIFGGTETEASTNRVVGTYGYMSPEYAVDGYFSTMSDVFSFGVLVLEIVSGKKNRGFSHPDHHHNLLGHAWLLCKEGRHQELANPHVIEPQYTSQVLRSIHVALLCVQQNPEDRPKMSYVVLMLASDGPLPMPKEPGFFTERNMFFEPERNMSFVPESSSSNKQADSSGNFSITLLEPR